MGGMTAAAATRPAVARTAELLVKLTRNRTHRLRGLRTGKLLPARNQPRAGDAGVGAAGADGVSGGTMGAVIG